MANTILNFHFDYWNPSLIQNPGTSQIIRKTPTEYRLMGSLHVSIETSNSNVFLDFKQNKNIDKNGFILGVVIISRIRLVLITIMF